MKYMIATALILSATSAVAATTVPMVYGSPEAIEEGIRFLGNREDYDVKLVKTAAMDGEPMYAAVYKGSKKLRAFFREGDTQCYSKIGGPVPCNMVEESAIPPFKTSTVSPVYPMGTPIWSIPPSWAVPGVPWVPGIFHPNKPPKTVTPGDPNDPDKPIDPDLPPLAPVPIPWTVVMYLTAIAMMAKVSGKKKTFKFMSFLILAIIVGFSPWAMYVFAALLTLGVSAVLIKFSEYDESIRGANSGRP